MVCDSTYSYYSVDEHTLPSPNSTTTITIMDDEHRIDSKRQVSFQERDSKCLKFDVAPVSALKRQPLALPSPPGLSSSASPSAQYDDTRSNRKRKLEELLIDIEEDYEALTPHTRVITDRDPLCAEACALWRKGPSCPKCAYCNSYRHEAHGCEHLLQRVSALGRYFRDLARSDPRRARGWFALYLRNCPDTTKLSCITELLYRRACQQGVWKPIFSTNMQWPCVEEYALREFMVVCASYPTLWMTPSELLVTKKALMNETILLHSPSSSISSSPRCSPIHENDEGIHSS